MTESDIILTNDETDMNREQIEKGIEELIPPDWSVKSHSMSSYCSSSLPPTDCCNVDLHEVPWYCIIRIPPTCFLRFCSECIGECEFERLLS